MTSPIKINFLGTSSAIPTKNRSHSAILLTYNEENILIDCGEGTQRQFRLAKLNPCKITKILITHKHGDHVLGLVGLFSTLAVSDYNKTLEIYGPKGTKKFIEDLLKLFKFKRDYEIKTKEVQGKFFENDEFYLEAENMNHGTPANAYNFVIKDKLRIDKKKLEKAKIPKGKHLSELQKGKDIKIKNKTYKAKDLTYTQKGKKISIVLDTLNNDKIPKFVKDADVFISESSFASDLKDTAKEHFHMTSEEAGMNAKKAKVKKLFLTHISQRYEKDKKFLLGDAKKHFKNTRIAKDFDKIEV